MTGYIYKTTNLKNGKIYIGQHSVPNTRKKYLGSGLLIKKAIQKHGKESFKIEVICYLSTKHELDQFEKHLISKYREIVGESGIYNLADGGEGGNINADHVRKVKKALTGRKQPRALIEKRKIANKALNRHLTPEHKQAISEAQKKKIFTPQMRLNLSKNKKGKSMSMGARDKIRQARIKYWEEKHGSQKCQTVAN